MIRLRLIVAIMMAAWVAGCATHGWKHDGIPASDWDKDYADCFCQAESEARAAGHPIRSGSGNAYGQAESAMQEAEIRYWIERCMEEKGYYR